LETGTKIEIHNNDLPSKKEISSFCLEVGRIIDNFHLSIVPMATLDINISSWEGKLFFWRGGSEIAMQLIRRMWHYGVDVAYPQLNNCTCLQ